jgi:hypothetical protein
MKRPVKRHAAFAFVSGATRRYAIMADGVAQKDNLAEILNRVSDKVSSSEARSLWERMRNEMRSGGPDAAARYIGTELDRCKQDFERELTALHEARARRQGHD